MGLGILLIVVAVAVLVGLGYKANQSVVLARNNDKTEDNLASFGYKQELLRDMGGFQNFAISFSIISILTGAVTLYGFGFDQGGPAIMGMGWPLVTIFVLFIAAAMAELASAIPTSGALYHWSSILGGPKWGWFTAWFNLVGLITIIAGIDFGAATFSSNLLFGQPSKTQLLIVYAIILLSHAILNHVGIHVVAILNSVSAIYHLIGVSLLIGVLVYFGPHQNVSYLFNTDFSTVTSSTTPYWFAFLVGLLQAAWTYTGYDASAHTSEETIDPRVRSPWGIYMSVAVSSVFGFIMLALVTLSIKDPSAVAASGGDGFITAIKQATGGVFGEVVLWMVTIAMWFAGLSSITSASRMIYAFSRDHGMPFSKIWAKVSQKYRTPASAIWLSTVLAFTSALADNVYAVVTSISVIGLYGSYGIPIFLKLRAQFKGAWNKKDNGPWNLGNWSTAVNLIAVAWIVFISIVLVISPSDVQLTKTFTLHYATGITFGIVLILLIIWYMIQIRKHFKGPHLGTYVHVRERILSTTKALKESVYKDI